MTRGSLLVAAAVLVGGCSFTPKTYVMLVEEPDGSVGQVQVRGEQGSRDLAQPDLAQGFDARRNPVQLAADRILETFGRAFGAAPPEPERFTLYFENNRTELVPESEAELARLLEAIRTRPAPEVEIWGHADRTAPDSYNAKLSAERAQRVRRTVIAAGADPELVIIMAWGEARPVVPTPDNVREPRNRRVEIAVR